MSIYDSIGQTFTLSIGSPSLCLRFSPLNSSIFLAIHQTATQRGRAIRLRIRVTGLDAMCRMIHNGLGVGVMPRRAFDLMHDAGALTCVPLTDAWATRRIDLVARDFSTLPMIARLLVNHLTQHAPDTTEPTE